MKKVVLVLILIFGLLTGYSQQYPVNQFIGAPNTLVTSKGAFKTDSALILPVFTDTSKANISPYIKNYAGTLIRVGDSLYVRSNDISKWLLLGSGGGGGLDSITANNGLTANTTSNVQLGGTLIQPTSILTNANEFTIERGANGNTLQVVNSSTGVSNDKTALYATSTDGNAGEFLAGNTLIANNAVQGVVKITRTTSLPPSPNYNEIGGAIDFINPTVNGLFSPAIAYTNRIASRWENSVSDPINSSYAKSRFELYGYKNGAIRNLAMVGDGRLILDQYGAGLFEGTPVYKLGVDASGNVIEDTTSSGGGGTVTSVATGYGLSGGTITNTGTLIADTSVSGLSGKYLRLTDTATMLTPYTRGSGLATRVAFWGGSRSLTYTSNIAIDASNPAFPALQVSDGTAQRSFLTPTSSGTQNTANDYAITTTSGSTPFFNAHNGTTNRESRLYPTKIQFTNLSTSGFVNLNSPISYNNTNDTLPNASGVLAISVNNVKADSSGNITLTTGGTGTVTSITQGYGITNSPNPIVSTGTVTVDTSTGGLSGKYLRLTDSSSMLSPYLRKIDTTNRFVNNISRTLGKDSIIFNIGSTRYAIKDSVGTNPAPVGYYGAFSDTLNQLATVINTGYPMEFKVNDITPNGVTIASNSRITFANSGIYNLQWSAQFTSSDNAEADVSIWLRKNGTDVAGSRGLVAVPKKIGSTNGHALPSWNFVLNVASGEYYEFVWSTANLNVFIEALPITAFSPSTASAILTVTQQSGIMAGTGITAINSLTGAAQTIVAGTSGTDFAVSSTGTTHTLNLPDASASNRGALTSANWTTFNNKIGASDTSVFQRKNIAAYSFQANNTASSANVTTQTFTDVAEQSMANTISFTAGAAPTGLTSANYSWTQVGKTVTVNFNAIYTTPGTTISSLFFNLPSDLPAPLVPTGWSGASAYLYNGSAAVFTTSILQNNILATSFIRRNAANTAYELGYNGASATARGFKFTLIYKAQ